MKQQVFDITQDDFGMRADAVIARELRDLSRGYIKNLAKEDKLLFKGKPVNSGYKLRAEGQLVLDYDMSVLSEIPELPLDVIFEDSNIIVINKESGVITHSRGRYWDEPSLASSIRRKLSDDPDSIRAGIVHRLDRATSGVIICAKNPETTVMLQEQFAARTVQKTYIAVIPRIDIPDEGLIDKPIGRDPKKPSCFRVHKEGKPAQTSFKVLAKNDEFMKLELYPKTGRTHQLRVHLASIGAAIVGDELYEGAKSDRLMLHAYKLQINYPEDAEAHFEAPVPNEFNTFTT